MIEMRQELVRLAGLIEWGRFDEAFGPLYAEKGRPGLPTRLMVGLHMLKHSRGISDEQVCAQWIVNAYFEFFRGESYFQTKLPLDCTSMSVWRGQIGVDKLELLLAETLAAVMRAKAVDKSQMLRVTFDTTPSTVKRELRRPSAIEPDIGHTKSDSLIERNRLAGARGDAVNAIPVGAGHGVLLLLAWLKVVLCFLCTLIISNGSPPKYPGALAQPVVC